MRDLLRLPAAPGYAATFTADAFRTFANDGGSLAVSDGLWADYQGAAQVLARKVAQDPAALGRLLPAAAPPAGKERVLAFIKELGRRAYRRPLDEAEVAAYSALHDKGPTVSPGTDGFASGARVVLEAMLQSPHFLYRTELTTGAGRVRLSEYEIASKLSYALTGTMPDDELFAAAARKGLGGHEQVTAEAERLLGKGAEPGFTFHEELLGLRSLAGEIDKDTTRYPEFKPEFRDSITKEASLFVAEVFNAGQGLAELLTAPFTFVDANLALLYGVKAPPGGGFARVELDPRPRAGLLTQTAFLARYGSAESDPILRGAYVNHALLCLDLEPPPGATENVPEPPASAKTNRERVAAVTSPPQCATCHAAFINPAGFAFENYDAIGKFRTTESGQPVNAADTYNFNSGPKSFKDAVEFSRVLARSPEAHDCYARSWFTYLQGRLTRPEDEPFVKWLADRTLTDGLSMRSLALTVVTDDSFLTRLP